MNSSKYKKRSPTLVGVNAPLIYLGGGRGRPTLLFECHNKRSATAQKWNYLSVFTGQIPIITSPWLMPKLIQ